MGKSQHSRIACSGVLIGFAAAGCTSLGVQPSGPVGPSSQTIAADVRTLYESAQHPVPTTEHKGKTDDKGQALKTISVEEFARAGYRLVERSCNDYFDAVAKASNRLKMSKADLTSIGAAAAVIATLAEATPKEVGIIAASLGLGSSILNNFEQYAFATPYPIQTRGLVFKALDAFKAVSPPESAASLDDAADRVGAYARLCTYSGIATLSEQALQKAEPADLSEPTSMYSEQQRVQFLGPVDRVLAVPAGVTLTDNDYVVLAAIAEPSVTQETQIATLKAMLSDASIAPRVLEGTKKIEGTLRPIRVLLSQLSAANAVFASRVSEVVGATETGEKVAPETLLQPSSRIPLIGVR